MWRGTKMCGIEVRRMDQLEWQLMLSLQFDLDPQPDFADDEINPASAVRIRLKHSVYIRTERKDTVVTTAEQVRVRGGTVQYMIDRL